jgi:hypothetical protein
MFHGIFWKRIKKRNVKKVQFASILLPDFVVDVHKAQLRERNNPTNRLSILNMEDTGKGYVLQYDPKEKNIAAPWETGTIVKIPEMVQLDPAGMAKKYGLKPEDLKGKSDLEIMTGQEVLHNRINKGMLPAIDIAGHSFYVDIQMDKLRPKDDFRSKGIAFSEIRGYYRRDEEAYTIPYNPQTRAFQKTGIRTITAFPKDLIMVSFPPEWVLDRVGWNRKHGLKLFEGLKRNGLPMQFTAQVVPWEKTFIAAAIKKNLEHENRKRLTEATPKKETAPQEQLHKRGRKM